jgi:hypothetical protein
MDILITSLIYWLLCAFTIYFKWTLTLHYL